MWCLTVLCRSFQLVFRDLTPWQGLLIEEEKSVHLTPNTISTLYKIWFLNMKVNGTMPHFQIVFLVFMQGMLIAGETQYY
jgi:hypothetical protein